MNLYIFYQKLFKLIPKGFLTLVIAFSFYSYASDFIYESEDRDHKTHPFSYEPTDNFGESLKSHYTRETSSGMYGGGDVVYRFDHGQSISQAFLKECPDQYDSFTRSVEGYFNKATYGQTMNSIQGLQMRCKSLLKRDYLDLYKAINKFLSRAPGLKDSFQNAGYHEDWPNMITGMKEFFDEFAGFESCVKTVFASYNDHNIHGKPLEPLLEGLAEYSSDCDKKEFIKGFFTSNQEIFDHIASLPQICAMSTECVAELKMKLPAVRNISQEELSQSLFGICSAEENKTAVCCNDVESCEYLDGNEKAQYKSQIQSYVSDAGSGGGDVCAPNSPNLQSMETGILEERRNICEQSVKRCESSGSDCETELQDFKESFLKCFVVPKILVDAHIPSCLNHIKAIQTAYREYSRRRNKQASLSLDSTIDEIARCSDPLEALKRNAGQRQASARAKAQKLCYQAQEQRAAQQQGGIAALSPPNTYGSGDPSLRRGSRPSSANTNLPLPGVAKEEEYGIKDFDDASVNKNVGDSKREYEAPPEYASDDDKRAKASQDEEGEGGDEKSAELPPCMGICPEGSPFPEPKDYNKWMDVGDWYEGKHSDDLKRKEMERELAKEAEEQKRRAREDAEAGSGLSGFFKRSKLKVERAYRDTGKKARKLFRKAYKAVVGEKEKPPSIADLIPMNDEDVDLIRLQFELGYIFCSEHETKCGMSPEELEELRKKAGPSQLEEGIGMKDAGLPPKPESDEDMKTKADSPKGL